MIQTRKVSAIFKKQVKDTWKNKAVLIQFILFPLFAVVMANTVDVPGESQNYFVHLFATMYIGMAPLVTMASIIAEEKETETLRVLFFSNVSAAEYLLGEGLYVILACMLGAGVFTLQGGYVGMEAITFLVIMFAGILTSTVLGAVIGVWGKNQMAATAIAIPIMMALGFLPMIAMFNEKVKNVSQYLYTQQLNNWINHLDGIRIERNGMIVVIFNAMAAMILFGVSYKRRGMIQ